MLKKRVEKMSHEFIGRLRDWSKISSHKWFNTRYQLHLHQMRCWLGELGVDLSLACACVCVCVGISVPKVMSGECYLVMLGSSGGHLMNFGGFDLNTE